MKILIMLTNKSNQSGPSNITLPDKYKLKLTCIRSSLFQVYITQITPICVLGTDLRSSGN